MRGAVVSLNRRLLWMAGAIVLIFLGLTGGVLDQAFRQSLDRAQDDRLLGAVYTILAAAELGSDGLLLPADLPDGRLSTPGAGLYAQILDTDGVAWSSPSLLGVGWHPDLRLPAGEAMSYRRSVDQTTLHALAYGLSWEDAAGRQAEFTVHVAEDAATYRKQLNAFRTSLWGWLGAAAIGLLVAQVAVLQWSLRPLRTVTRDLRAIEEGRSEFLQGRYPVEIAGLIQSLNTLLHSERGRTTRYRDTLANLAHSLKTPLAVLRASLEGEQLQRDEALEQIERIDASVQYQLKRAAAGGSAALAAPLPVAPVLERLARALAKAYRDKALDVDLRCAPDAMFSGAEGDLMELLGNLLDNAHKWARSQIRVGARPIAGRHGGRPGLALTVEDDGPGIEPAEAQAVLARGVRADEQVPGHGIGLAVVADLVASFDGDLRISRSELGGACISIEILG